MMNGLVVNCRISAMVAPYSPANVCGPVVAKYPVMPDPVDVGAARPVRLELDVGIGLMMFGFQIQITLCAPAFANRSWMCRQAATNSRRWSAWSPRVPVAVHLVPEAERYRQVSAARPSRTW